MEVICINDSFAPEWEAYFKVWGILKPVANKVYGIRDIVPNTVGEKGLLLAEVVNKPTPRISPSTGMKGMAEQNWAISRFTTLLGKPLSKETISETIKALKDGNFESILRGQEEGATKEGSPNLCSTCS